MALLCALDTETTQDPQRRWPAPAGISCCEQPCWMAQGSGMFYVWNNSGAEQWARSTSCRQLKWTPKPQGQRSIQKAVIGVFVGHMQCKCPVPRTLYPRNRKSRVPTIFCPFFPLWGQLTASEGNTDHFHQANHEQRWVFGKGFQTDAEVKMTLPAVLSNMWELPLKSPSVKVAACVNLLPPPFHSRTTIRMAISSEQHVHALSMHIHFASVK